MRGRTLYSSMSWMALSLNSQTRLSLREYSITLSAFASNFKLRPRLLLLPSEQTTMKLDVIFESALPEMPSLSATLKDGKYLF